MKKRAHLYAAAVLSLLPPMTALLIFWKAFAFKKNPFESQDFVLGVILTVLIMPTFYFLAVWISWLLEAKEKLEQQRIESTRTNHNKEGDQGSA